MAAKDDTPTVEKAPDDVAPKVEGKGVLLRVAYPHHIHAFRYVKDDAEVVIGPGDTEVAKGAVKDLIRLAAESGVVLEEVAE